MAARTGQTGIDRTPGMIPNVPRAFSYVLPVDYRAGARARYPVVFVLHGITGDHTNWLENTSILRHVAPHPFILVMPDADDSWYADAYDGTCDYETYFIGELLPYVTATFRAADSREGRGLIGLSMGGYGAVKLALQYPDLFSAAAGHSSAFHRVREQNPPGQPDPVFGDWQRDLEHRRRNDPYDLVETLLGSPLMPGLFLDCGLDDPLIDGNRRFHEHLVRLHVPHEYAERPGHHTWPYWNRSVRHSLAWMAGRLQTPQED